MVGSSCRDQPSGGCCGRRCSCCVFRVSSRTGYELYYLMGNVLLLSLALFLAGGMASQMRPLQCQRSRTFRLVMSVLYQPELRPPHCLTGVIGYSGQAMHRYCIRKLLSNLLLQPTDNRTGLLQNWTPRFIGIPCKHCVSWNSLDTETSTHVFGSAC